MLGSRVIWLASLTHRRKRRWAVAGTNCGSQVVRRRSDSSTSRHGPINWSARGVGAMPPGVRTNSGSFSSSRKRPNQILTVG
ncbi:hypothetical protein D3C79_1009800 [compost metagenome]